MITCKETGKPCARTCGDFDDRGVPAGPPHDSRGVSFGYRCQERIRAMTPEERNAAGVPSVLAAEADREGVNA